MSISVIKESFCHRCRDLGIKIQAILLFLSCISCILIACLSHIPNVRLIIGLTFIPIDIYCIIAWYQAVVKSRDEAIGELQKRYGWLTVKECKKILNTW